MKIGKYKPSQIRKAIVAGTGAATELGNSFIATFTDVLPPKVSAGIAGAVGVLTLVGVFLVKNEQIIDAADSLG